MNKITDDQSEADYFHQTRDDYETWAPFLHVSVTVSNARLQRALERQAQFDGITVEQYCARAIALGMSLDQWRIFVDQFLINPRAPFPKIAINDVNAVYGGKCCFLPEENGIEHELVRHAAKP